MLTTALLAVPRLTTLTLGDNSSHDEGIKALSAALSSVPRLTSLSLSNNRIGAAGAKSLAAALHAVPQLTILIPGFSGFPQGNPKPGQEGGYSFVSHSPFSDAFSINTSPIHPPLGMHALKCTSNKGARSG